MFFLIRMVFWFSLVLLVLPLDTGRTPGSPPPVSPFQALSAAREAIGDVAGLCERKPDVCVTGRAAFETIGSRAREGARIAYELLDDGSADTDASISTGSVPNPAKPAAAASAD
ncbi:MAG: DUF5330 domain-containing protein [Rhizobiaceae bacterium]|nr:MAG: DUF5330 domain-containing protein [Rhizobiaceae bacterium]CAG0994888.1 hypothetical protein RHIZO_02456 [Rhizobiaceae bacterium]